MKNILVSFLFLILTFNNSFGQVDPVTGQYSDKGNLLVNPGYESGLKSWTNSAGTFSLESSVVIKGKRAGKVVLSSQALNFYQDSTQFAAQLADGVQGLASIRVKTSVSGLRVCPRQAGLINSNLCVSVVANNKWGLYKVPFSLGDTSNGISINSNGTSVSGTVYLDDAYVAAVDLTADIDNSSVEVLANIGGAQISISTIASSYTEVTHASLDMVLSKGSATIPCSGVNASTGLTCSAGSESVGVVYNVKGGGTEEVCFDFTSFVQANLLDALATFQVVLTENSSQTILFEGKKKIMVGGNGSNAADTEYYPTQICGLFDNLSPGLKTFRLMYEKQYATSLSILADRAAAAGQRDIAVTAKHFTSSSSYSSTNADTDWTNLSNVSAGTLITATTTSPTYGTTAVNKAQWKRQGSDLLIKWDYRQTSAGTNGSGVYLFNIPSSTGCVIDTSKTPANSGVVNLASSTDSTVGSFTYADGVNDGYGSVFVHSTSQLKMSFNYAGTTTGRVWFESGANLFGKTAMMASLSARVPCVGWENSNLIIAQLSGLEKCENTLSCTDTFSARVNSAGVVSSENVDFINGNCTAGSGIQTCTFNPAIFTVAPNCTATTILSTNTATIQITSLTNTGVAFITRESNTGTPLARDMHFICQKQGVDFVSKTAKAVASDQNLRSPGITNSVLCSAKISNTGVITDQQGGCFASCTNVTTPVCTFTTNYWASTPNCWVNSTGGGFNGDVSVTTTSMSGIIYSTSFAAFNAPRNYVCHGIKQ